MSMAFSRSFSPVPVCSQTSLRLAAFPAGRAKRQGRAEGKIKEHGTPSRQFGKFLLSAHWLAGPQAAPRLWASRAAIVRNPLALLGFDRHYGGEMADFRQIGLGLRP
ncbi:hypothetical protein MLD63_11115 [Paracoccus sp. TK19116]|uniref:Uncharacterized protein n=1 Tax=Paracoccus albicereus TaxID=2922394 RepID=A0ABT1MS01_9RHOB|nr:hypothetical protein [Paracoccus albicereus]MCQ0970976.1 hypothetical protein [Paracoccus albicereus]